MRLYLDTSAIVPLILSEPATGLCSQLWKAAIHVSTVRIAFVEAAAALAMAERLKRISEEQHLSCLKTLRKLWGMIDVVEVSDDLTVIAADLARRHGLRGYDAVHCAAALTMKEDPALVAAAGDARLLAAWRAMGIATSDTNSARDYANSMSSR
ncbi:type II toxin-antitoxin system VapC family toxin [Leucobacter insecticola]|uniref:Type II toxin-antitoxin system VapC family toxin n=1 Tax=Leucobacter insecticola TaxID=2714934 RepID=A0A6G8FJI2_9MICO|nr:type II toxin-antitoxin system VapC family toxin [Leucobacter insecticola]QIM16498.1 type II toxin-antitoxin system VapC family toxin [Leucobacter insecticola]